MSGSAAMPARQSSDWASSTALPPDTMTRCGPRPMRRCFLLSHESDTVDLLESSFAGLHQRGGRVAQRDRARGARRFFQLARRSARDDELPKLVIQDHELADRLAPAETGVSAVLATVRAAGLANDSYQALRQHAV